ncbi:MAG: hypothetical protein L3V56_14985 [Candidatus Magnetoovum sp. WYHC-5]|nr:hypothetical protein [Candidatus Magnetoovum sp. WYHC-5]
MLNEIEITFNAAGDIDKEDEWFWTEEVQERLKKAQDNFNKGQCLTFKTMDDLIEYLNAKDCN